MGFKTVSTILNLRITKKLLGDDMLGFIPRLNDLMQIANAYILLIIMIR
jgi:hypothetical protein